MNLKFVKIDVVNHTAEAQWFEDVLNEQAEVVGSVSVKCTNYSEGNKAEFLSEVEGAASYVGALGWN